MLCPRCHTELVSEQYFSIEVDRCPACQGMWLDYQELDELEDRAFADDVAKATLLYKPHPSDLACPRCGGSLHTFDYRGWDLQLDFCEQEHGFWLDQGEERRVLELMHQRESDLERAASAEEEWEQFLKRLKSKSTASKLKGLLAAVKVPDVPRKQVLLLPWRKRFVLFWRMLRDDRIPVWAKLVIPGILFYVALPFDLIPDFIPFVGYIDDVFAAVLGLWLFLRLTPRHLFDEHMERILTELKTDAAP